VWLEECGILSVGILNVGVLSVKSIEWLIVGCGEYLMVECGMRCSKSIEWWSVKCAVLSLESIECWLVECG